MPQTALVFAGSISFLLTTWKNVEEIKKLWREAEKQGFSSEEAEMFFNAKIKSNIENRIAEAVAVALQAYQGEEGRKHELENTLTWAMNRLLAMIERGMVVDTRHLPGPNNTSPEESDDNRSESTEDDLHAKLVAVSQALRVKVQVGGPPVLGLNGATDSAEAISQPIRLPE